MFKKIILPLVVVLVVALAAGAAYLHYRTGQPGQNPGQPKNSVVLGTLVTTTPSSVTITTQDGSQKTFSVTSTTQVVTQVQSGEVGKSLAEIAAGTQVLVQPADSSATAAQRVTIMPVPTVLNTDPAGPPVVMSGIVVGTTTTSLTIKTADQSLLRIAIAKDAVLRTNVLAGQKGKTFADIPLGMYVQVFGSTGRAGITAHSIQLLVPLVQ